MSEKKRSARKDVMEETGCEAGQRTELAFVGGLLGAGKTTLLRAAARHLTARGRKVALITNDQTGQLVDTVFLRRAGLAVEEVAGSCFCCDFNGLTESILALLRNESPDIILAEPVGSCTDLQATVIRPMRDLMGQAVDVLPLTVLVDPGRLAELEGIAALSASTRESALSGGEPAVEAGAASLDYLFRQQMEEADVIGLTKIDLLEEPRLHAVLDGLRQDGLRQGVTSARLCGISARSGQGIDEWWQALHEKGEAASVLQNIDYDLYARAEAAMGWLNARLRVDLPADEAPGRSLSDFVADVTATVQQRSGLIGNFKVIAADAAGWLRVGVTRVGQPPDLEEGGFSGPAAELTVNIRATLPAMDLHDIIMQNARRWPMAVEHVDYLHPSAPNPTHRYA